VVCASDVAGDMRKIDDDLKQVKWFPFAYFRRHFQVFKVFKGGVSGGQEEER